ncbi:MAG TPA: hypothetical protein VMU68_06375 [Acidimicrobiales bacterium]|nr:hypothetical protein [Acidimicrobiales bacterium]
MTHAGNDRLYHPCRLLRVSNEYRVNAGSLDRIVIAANEDSVPGKAHLLQGNPELISHTEKVVKESGDFGTQR